MDISRCSEEAIEVVLFPELTIMEVSRKRINTAGEF